MDMQQPLLDILFAYTESTDTPLGDSREEVEEKLNAWASGYLEAEQEGDGLAKDYNISNIELNL